MTLLMRENKPSLVPPQPRTQDDTNVLNSEGPFVVKLKGHFSFWDPPLREKQAIDLSHENYFLKFELKNGKIYFFVKTHQSNHTF